MQTHSFFPHPELVGRHDLAWEVRHGDADEQEVVHVPDAVALLRSDDAIAVAELVWEAIAPLCPARDDPLDLIRTEAFRDR